MIEYEELRADIDCYLMERFKYRKSLVRLTVEMLLPPEETAELICIYVSGELKANFQFNHEGQILKLKKIKNIS